MMYYGWADPQVTPMNSVNCFNDVVRKLGSNVAGKSIELYMVPGMNRCIGGPGTDTFSKTAEIEQWVHWHSAEANPRPPISRMAPLIARVPCALTHRPACIEFFRCGHLLGSGASAPSLSASGRPERARLSVRRTVGCWWRCLADRRGQGRRIREVEHIFGGVGMQVTVCQVQRCS